MVASILDLMTEEETFNALNSDDVVQGIKMVCDAEGDSCVGEISAQLLLKCEEAECYEIEQDLKRALEKTVDVDGKRVKLKEFLVSKDDAPNTKEIIDKIADPIMIKMLKKYGIWFVKKAVDALDERTSERSELIAVAGDVKKILSENGGIVADALASSDLADMMRDSLQDVQSLARAYNRGNEYFHGAEDKFYHSALDNSLNYFNGEILEKGYIDSNHQGVIVAPDINTAVSTAELIKDNEFKNLINDAEFKELLKDNMAMWIIKLLTDENLRSLVQNNTENPICDAGGNSCINDICAQLSPQAECYEIGDGLKNSLERTVNIDGKEVKLKEFLMSKDSNEDDGSQRSRRVVGKIRNSEVAKMLKTNSIGSLKKAANALDEKTQEKPELMAVAGDVKRMLSENEDVIQDIAKMQKNDGESLQCVYSQKDVKNLLSNENLYNNPLAQSFSQLYDKHLNLDNLHDPKLGRTLIHYNQMKMIINSLKEIRDLDIVKINNSYEDVDILRAILYIINKIKGGLYELEGPDSKLVDICRRSGAWIGPWS